jgi:hypothetical protein
MLPSALVYLGLIAAGVGAVSVLIPLAFLGIRRRATGLRLMVVGVAIVVVGLVLPAREVRNAAPKTQLDHFMPAYQFSEIHTARIRAPRDRVYRAIKSVTADEISLFRALTSIRRFGRPGPESILNAPEKMPLLDVATKTSFLLLAEQPGREIVVGTLVAAPPGWRPPARPTPEGFKALHDPGFALAAMNFLVEDAGPGVCLVTTETRVYATDASTCRRFAGYWRVIYPGSAVIRRMWLRAIKKRAELPPS